jgi:hypothetical protein
MSARHKEREANRMRTNVPTRPDGTTERLWLGRWMLSTMLLSLALIVIGCAGRDFVRPETESLALGRTTYQEVRDRFGSPLREGAIVKNGVSVRTTGYAYSSAGGATLVGGVTPARGMDFYFVDDRLVGYAFLSSYAEDHTDFDESKVGAIKKGETTRAQVLETFGKPGGTFTYPLIKGRDDQALVYAYSQTRGTAFNLKLHQKVLVVSHGPNAVVTDVEFTSVGEK